MRYAKGWNLRTWQIQKPGSHRSQRLKQDQSTKKRTPISEHAAQMGGMFALKILSVVLTTELIFSIKL